MTTRRPLVSFAFPYYIRAAFVFSISILLTDCYTAQTIAGQLRITTSTVSVHEAVRSRNINAAAKAKMRYIQRVRAFSEAELRLKKTRNYTVFLPGEKKPLRWVLLAAPKDRLTPLTWRFPIIGEIAYIGFFNLNLAEEKQKELEGQGYDVLVRPVQAYSTLGLFADPITPTMIDLDADALAELIIHELAHSTLYLPGQTAFNESFAAFVGRQGAQKFLQRKFGPDNVYQERLRRRHRADEVVRKLINELADKLRALYAERPPDMMARRGKLFSETKQKINDLKPLLKDSAYASFSDTALNNASVVAFLTYNDLRIFENAFESVSCDWPHFMELAQEAGKSADPRQRLKEITSQRPAADSCLVR